MAKKILEKFPEGHEKAGQLTGVIRFTFEGQEDVTIDVNALSDEVKFNRLVHGVSQTVGDSYAGVKGEADPAAAARAYAAETVKQLLAGILRASSGGGPRVTDLATVFAALNGVTVDEAVEFIGGLDEKQEKELRNKPKIKAQLLALTAKRAAEKAAAALAEAEKEGNSATM